MKDSTMNVQFTFTDAALLFCLPKTGYDLSSWVERYTCFERTGVPSYEEVAGCVSRAVRAGAMLPPTCGVYQLTPEWHDRVHQRDEDFAPLELAMIEFAEELELQVWPTFGLEFVLPLVEYEQAAEHTRQYLDLLFARHSNRRSNEK